MPTVLVPVVVLANGIAAGVLLSTQLGGWPLLRSLPAAQYVHAHAFFSTRYDPLMPICILLTGLGDLTLTILNGNTFSRACFGLAAVCAISTTVISFARNVPGNKVVRTFDPDNLPDDFAERDPRRYWGVWNRRRSALAVFAFLLNCVALSALL